jgi:hypothetical protein
MAYLLKTDAVSVVPRVTGTVYFYLGHESRKDTKWL